MNLIDVLGLIPNIYQRAKVWEFEYDKIWYFGPGNSSGTLRFTNNHDLNDSVIVTWSNHLIIKYTCFFRKQNGMLMKILICLKYFQSISI